MDKNVIVSPWEAAAKTLLVEDSRKWFSTKTKLTNRDLMTMYYAPLRAKAG